MDKHKYIRGIQCDNEDCYACATQRHNCNRLDKLDKQNRRASEMNRKICGQIKMNRNDKKLTDAAVDKFIQSNSNMMNDIVGEVFGKDKQKLLESNTNTSKKEILAKIKDNLKKASMLHYGIEKYITYGTSHIIELKNGWVVEMDRNGGRVLHIYEDKR